MGCLMTFKGASRYGNVADRMSRSAKRHQEKYLLSMGLAASPHEYLRHRIMLHCDNRRDTADKLAGGQ
jgi:hypothetical protein